MGGRLPPKKNQRELDLLTERGEVEEKQLQFVVVAFIACLFGCIIVFSHDGLSHQILFHHERDSTQRWSLDWDFMQYASSSLIYYIELAYIYI
jgi:hypothetical protein